MVSFRLSLRELVFKGGPGSGHHGHAGRPGARGGSLPGAGGVSCDWSGVSDDLYDYVIGDRLTRNEIENMLTLPGMTLEMSAEEKTPEEIRIRGEWKSAVGRPVGHFERIFAVGDYEHERVVGNESLAFDAKFQNHGLATSLYDRQIAQLRKAGFDRIELLADSSIGRYAWARKGFDYKYKDEVRSVSDRFKMWATSKKRNIPLPSGGWPEFKTAHDVASYDVPGVSIVGNHIFNPDVPGDMRMHVGKAFMLDRSGHGHGSWDAVLNLKD